MPRSKLAKTLAEINRICASYDLRVGYVFHAGDGNLHPLILFNPQDEAMVKRMHAAGQEVMELCVEVGGTITGEHGVGSEKRQYMRLMFNEDELRVMQDIKEVFDPRNLMNPGKIVPELAAGEPAPRRRAAPGGRRRASTRRATLPMRPTSCARGTRAGAACASGAAAPSRACSRRPTSVLSTRELCGIKAYELNDLFVTVGAGTPAGRPAGAACRRTRCGRRSSRRGPRRRSAAPSRPTSTRRSACATARSATCSSR